MVSGGGGCSAHKLLLQPGTTTESHHQALMQGPDKRFLVQGRLGAENGVDFAALLLQMESLCGEEHAGERALEKNRSMNRAQSEDFCHKQINGVKQNDYQDHFCPQYNFNHSMSNCLYHFYQFPQSECQMQKHKGLMVAAQIKATSNYTMLSSGVQSGSSKI